MIEAQIPPNEARRLGALKALCILDTPPEERFDSITRLAQQIFRVPCALISFIDADRQWFKSRQGTSMTQTERGVSFCAHAILADDVMVVRDAAADLRFCDNPLVTAGPAMRFYAGYPLKVPSGERLGTLCIIDSEPRGLSDYDSETLAALGAMVERELSSEIGHDVETGLLTRAGFMLVGRYCVDWCRHLGRLWAVRLFWVTRQEREVGRGDPLSAADARKFAAMLTQDHGAQDVIARLSKNLFGVVQVGRDVDSEVTRGIPLWERVAMAPSEARHLVVDESCVSFDGSSLLGFREQLVDAWIELHMETRRRNVEGRAVQSERELLQLVAFTAIYRSLLTVAPLLRRCGSLFEEGYGTICCRNERGRLSQVRLQPAILGAFYDADSVGRRAMLAEIADRIRDVVETNVEYRDIGLADMGSRST